ncbi:MAG: hypothetical protein U9O82_00205 [Thermodesulfobacteriota bacterium]|nr:hypothetical protein [Thermodesulfobacteriota bacterium]
MGKSILCICLAEEGAQYIKVEKRRAGLFPQPPETAVTQESLFAACRRADEIYISRPFPTALYEWVPFPKVKNEDLLKLINRDALEKHGTASSLDCRYQIIGDVLEDGVTKFLVAYVAVESNETTAILDQFSRFKKKIKNIGTLPMALAAAVTQAEHPEGNTLLVWVDKNHSIITICSPDGLVKLARSVPTGLKREYPTDDHDHLFSGFSEAISREISMTIRFFKQKFREPVPDTLYFLGNSRLQKAIETFPLSDPFLEIRFGSPMFPAQGMTSEEITENIHLLGNLFLPSNFNLILPSETLFAGTELLYKISIGVVVTLIMLSGLWGFRLYTQTETKFEDYASRLVEIERLEKEITEIESEINRNKPLLDRMRLYETTSASFVQPQWSRILYDLASAVSPKILINRYHLSPSGSGWDNSLAGEIKAGSWQEGLSTLRKFGKSINSSSCFDVKNINYSLGDMKSETKTYKFKLDLKFVQGK